MKRRDTIEYVPIVSLKEYAGNAKKHSERQIDLLARAISEYGFNQPIVIDANNEIVAGHGRYRAAQQLKMDEVPCIRVTDLSDAKVRAYRLSDNRLNSLTDFDYEAVLHELSSLNSEGLDLEITGFDLKDLGEKSDKKGSLKMRVTKEVECPHCHNKHTIEV